MLDKEYFKKNYGDEWEKEYNSYSKQINDNWMSQQGYWEKRSERRENIFFNIITKIILVIFIILLFFVGWYAFFIWLIWGIIGFGFAMVDGMDEPI